MGGAEEGEAEEDEEGWIVREQEGGQEGVSTFTAQGPPSPAASSAAALSPPFLFRIVGGGSSGGSGVGGVDFLGGNEGGVAVAPDPLSMYRAPVDLMALGGQLDMEELMRVTMEQRRGRGQGVGGDGDGSSRGSDDEEEEEAAAEAE